MRQIDALLVGIAVMLAISVVLLGGLFVTVGAIEFLNDVSGRWSRVSSFCAEAVKVIYWGLCILVVLIGAYFLGCALLGVTA